MSVSELASVPCRVILKYLRDAAFQGCSTCHRGRLVLLGDAQCTAVQRGWMQHPGWSPAMGDVPPVSRVVCCPRPSWQGHPGDCGCYGKGSAFVLLCTVLDSSLSCHCCGSRTPGWHSWELVGIQAAFHSFQLPFEYSCVQRNHFLFPAPLAPLPSIHSCPPSLHPGGAQAGGGSRKAPKMPISPNRRKRRTTAGTNHC